MGTATLALLWAASAAGRGTEVEKGAITSAFVLRGEPVGCVRLAGAAGEEGAFQPAAPAAPAPLPESLVAAAGADGERVFANHAMVTRLDVPRGFVDRVEVVAAWPEGEALRAHAAHFCFSAYASGPFPTDGAAAYSRTFSLTREDGSREYGTCLTTLEADRRGLDGLLTGRTEARPLTVVVFSDWPVFRLCARARVAVIPTAPSSHSLAHVQARRFLARPLG